MTDAPHRDPRAWLLIAIPLLLPFGSASELPILIAALWALVLIVRGRIDWRAPATRLALALFAAYWLPELLSAPDSFAPRKSWIEVAADLRFGLLMLFATVALRDLARVRFVLAAVGVVLAVWCVDALLQAATGYSLGGAAQADRLSGIFGDDNLKLGGVIAALSPFALLPAWRRYGLGGALLALVPILAVILLAGARASWVALAVVLVAISWRQLGLRRGSVALAGLLVVSLIAAVAAHHWSPRFAERIDRTSEALRGDTAALDYALAGRLPIWRTALATGAAHPINGAGVRAFRYAYPDYAAAGDKWVDRAQGTGALHAHQLLLELWSETGSLGLLCWLLGAAIALRAWREASPAARDRAAAPAYALVAMLFPINTHYAVYSNFWSVLLFAMLALWVGSLHAREETR
jgi:O-antigen ligase